MSSWQDALLSGLHERNARDSVYSEVISDYRRLLQSTALLKERNQILLKAGATASSSASKPGQASNGEDNPVRAAYVTSLEAQINSLRDEIGQLYKTQGQNAQRLLTLSETLRESEDRSREEHAQLRSLGQQVDKLSRQNQDSANALKEKEKVIQHLNDELSTANLEFGQLEKRNTDLQQDNKNLLQRWLDRMNEEALQMNDANAFIESTSRLRASNEAQKGNSNEKPTTSKAQASRSTSRPASPLRASNAKGANTSSSSSSGRRTPTASSKTSKTTSSKTKTPTQSSPDPSKT